MSFLKSSSPNDSSIASDSAQTVPIYVAAVASSMLIWLLLLFLGGGKIGFGAVLLGLLFQGIILSGCFWRLWGYHHRFTQSIPPAIQSLSLALQRLGDGAPVILPEKDKLPQELVELTEGVRLLATKIQNQREANSQNEDVAARQHTLSAKILSFAREIASASTSEETNERTARAALELSNAHSCRIWLFDNIEKTFTAAFDTTTPTGVPPIISPPASLQALLERVTKSGMPTSFPATEGAGSGLILPMIHGIEIIALIEINSTNEAPLSLDNDTQKALETLSSHAATAITVTRLRRGVEERGETDGLTKLLNRRRMDNDLIKECRRSNRSQREFAYILLDVDHFKNFNDTFGHMKGDEVLRGVGKVLTNGIRETDTAYRYGGEEFAVLLRETGAKGAAELAERLRSNIAAYFKGHTKEESVTASFGVSIGTGQESPEIIIAAADKGLYEAKSSGRNRVVFGS